MDTRQKRNFLNAGSALNFLAVIVILCASFFGAPSGQIQADQELQSKTTLSTTHSSTSMESLEPLFLFKLQRAITETQAKATNKPQFTGKLIGTAISGTNSQAMFQLPSGQIELKSIGDDIASARIEDIKESAVTLAFQGELLILTVDPGAGQ